MSRRRFAGGIDSKMVWEPCSEHEPQIALLFSSPGLVRRDLGFRQQAFSFQSGIGAKGHKEPGEFLLAAPRSAFQLTRRQPY
jgi:hypothetical protein